MSTEATGGMANDLRDQRDLLVDKLSSFVNLNIYEDSNGMYSVVSNGVSLVNGINKLTLELSDPIANDTYGINDYTVLLKESGIAYQPTNGTLKAQMDQIEEDKAYIDYLAKMSAFMLTTFNHQHQQGIGIDSAACTATYGTEDFDDTSPTYGEITDSGNKVVTAAGTDLTGTSGVNFYGAADVIYTWDEATQTVTATKYSAGWHMVVSTYEKEEAGLINYYSKATVKENTGSTQTAETLKAIDIIKALELNAQLTAENGQNLVAARTWGTTTTSVDPTTHVATDLGTHVAEANGSGDGTNAVDLSTLFNMNQENTQIDFIAKQFTGNQQTGTDRRSMGTISLEAYYNQRMTALGSDAETMDSKSRRRMKCWCRWKSGVSQYRR